jgi:hypothetical protein
MQWPIKPVGMTARPRERYYCVSGLESRRTLYCVDSTRKGRWAYRTADECLSDDSGVITCATATLPRSLLAARGTGRRLSA